MVKILYLCYSSYLCSYLLFAYKMNPLNQHKNIVMSDIGLLKAYITMSVILLLIKLVLFGKALPWFVVFIPVISFVILIMLIFVIIKIYEYEEKRNAKRINSKDRRVTKRK